MATQTLCPIKSSKESFQQFRKVAIEKEERERARKLQLEAGREKSGTDKSRYKRSLNFQATQCIKLCKCQFGGVSISAWLAGDLIPADHSFPWLCFKT